MTKENINSSSGWCAIHLGCGGQLKAVSIDKEHDFVCSVCENELKDDKNIIIFENENETKLPQNISSIDILQMEREDRAKLVNPKTDVDNKEQKEMILESLDDKPLFF
jgi:hypothetical protein